jgi:hypothetical protein
VEGGPNEADFGLARWRGFGLRRQDGALAPRL